MNNKTERKYSQLDDETLVHLAQQGNNSAFDALLGQYRPSIKIYLLRRIANADAAEDILQDTFIKVYTSIHQFRGEASFKNWLYIITRNSWKNYLRSHQYQTLIDQYKDVYDLEITCDRQAPENILIQQQQSKLLRLAINALPVKQRTTLRLRINRQLPFAHIAAAMQCSLSTAKSNHYCGIKSVGRMIAA